MKIELEINNLKNLIDGLNNAIIAYADIRYAIWVMGGPNDSINPKWNSIIGDNSNNLTEKFDIRLKELRNIYEQLLKIEEGE